MPKKVLYIITKGNWGGAQRYVFDLATAAQKEGHSVAVAIGGEPGLLHQRLAEAHIRVCVLSELRNEATGGALVSAARILTQLLQQETPDVVHLNSSLAGFAGAYAARVTRIPHIIFTAHGWAFNEERSLAQRVLIYALHYATVVLAHQTICVSSAVQKDIVRLPFIERKTSVIHLGIPAPHLKERGAARSALAPGKENLFWFGMLGELHPTKGVFEATAAFEQVAKELPDALLVIMGEGSAHVELTRVIEQKKLSARIVLAGHVVDGASYLSAFDVFLFPSRTEALGYAAIEAGHAALPVVASRVGGIPEIIEDGSTGILLPKKDWAALARAMRALAADPALRRKLGESLRASVTARFSPDSMLKKTFTLYRS